MRAKPEFRDRNDVEVAVLDALVERGQEGMTLFEIRSHADVDIDSMEEALAQLKAEGLIEVEKTDERTLFRPADRVVPDPGEENRTTSLLDRLRDLLPF